MSKAFLPLLRASVGRIVNMISFCTDCPLPMLSGYTASKAALRSYSNGMRMEIRKFDVNLILFNPGDHPGQTPLCANQDVNFAKMEPEIRAIPDNEIFIGYFRRSRRYFSKLFKGPESPTKTLEDQGLYLTFNELVRVIDPEAEYVNSTLGMRLYFWMLSCLPTQWADLKRIELMRLPGLEEEYPSID